LLLSLIDNAITLIAYVAYLIAMVICGVAIRKGDRPLRLAAAVIVVGWALSALVGRRDNLGMNYPMSIIDTSVALILIWISMRWRRIWCAVLAALTIVAVTIPFVGLVDRDIHFYNRAASNNIVAILQLIVLIVAIWLTVRGRRRADEGAVRS
jgi:hypothetical protein